MNHFEKALLVKSIIDNLETKLNNLDLAMVCNDHLENNHPELNYRFSRSAIHFYKSMFPIIPIYEQNDKAGQLTREHILALIYEIQTQSLENVINNTISILDTQKQAKPSPILPERYEQLLYELGSYIQQDFITPSHGKFPLPVFPATQSSSTLLVFTALLQLALPLSLGNEEQNKIAIFYGIRLVNPHHKEIHILIHEILRQKAGSTYSSIIVDALRTLMFDPKIPPLIQLKTQEIIKTKIKLEKELRQKSF